MDPNNNYPGAGQSNPTPQSGADPYRPTNYAWQRGLGQQAPDNRIIPLPNPATEQPIQPVREAPAMPEQSPIVTPPMPAPQLPPTPPPQPLPPAQLFQRDPEPITRPAPPPKKRRWPAVLIILLVLIIALAAGLYFFVFKQSDKKEADKPATSSKTTPPAEAPKKTPAPSPTPTEQLAELSTLTMAKLNAPDDMGNYSLLAAADTFARYTSKTNGKCELGFGTLTATELAGDTLDAIIDAQIKALQSSGATVKGPSAGTVLKLADSGNTAKKYSMQTLQFEVSKDNVRAKSHYSAVVLKGGNRAVVNRTCYTEDTSEVADSDMAALDAIALRITITSQ